MTVSFVQAGIRVEKEQEFAGLKGAVERAFGAVNLQKFLKRLSSSKVRIRDFDGVLAQRCLERVDSTLQRSGKTAQALYRSLSMSDQGQMREFYLSKIEQVDLATRQKFHKLYQYY
jgi:hypothetical protein